MVNTKILLSVVIVVLIGVTAAGYQISNQNSTGFWQPTTTSSNTQSSGSGSQSSDSGTSTGTTAQASSGTGTSTGTTGTEVYSSKSSGQTGGSSNVISTSAAKTAAASAIDEPGATVGTATLHGSYYIVTVVKNGAAIGEIEVNARTGEVTGGSA